MSSNSETNFAHHKNFWASLDIYPCKDLNATVTKTDPKVTIFNAFEKKNFMPYYEKKENMQLEDLDKHELFLTLWTYGQKIRLVKCLLYWDLLTCTLNFNIRI